MPQGLLNSVDREIFYNLLAWLFAAQFRDILLIIRTRDHPPKNTALLVNKHTHRIILKGPTPNYLIDDSPLVARKKAVSGLYDLLRSKDPSLKDTKASDIEDGNGSDGTGSGYSTDASLEEVLKHDLSDDCNISSVSTGMTMTCPNDAPARRSQREV